MALWPKLKFLHFYRNFSMTSASFLAQRRLALLSIGSIFLLQACGGGQTDSVASLKPDQVKTVLAKARGNGPGVAGGVISDNAIVLAADGVRVIGAQNQLTTDNWLGLGSNSKSLTAMALAVQVERGKLKWTDTMETLFPELAKTMLPEYRKVTVLDVLTFRAGFRQLLVFAEFLEVPITTSTLTEQRLEFASWLFAQTPVNTPGSATVYNNASYVLAGAIIERANGKPFEQTMQETVLSPLGLRGQYALPQAIAANQPAGHLQTSPGVFEAVAVDSPIATDSVPAYVNSAGLLSMPIADYARYAQIHLQALRGKPTLLKAETYKLLYTDRGTEAGNTLGLGAGWAVVTKNGQSTYEFTGSVDILNAYIKIVPNDNRAVIVLTNYDLRLDIDNFFKQTSDTLLALKPIK
jgi:D-alanyl-D-alanine carboxypeptidase